MKRRLFSAMFASAPALALPVDTGRASAFPPPPSDFRGLNIAGEKAAQLNPLEMLQRKKRQQFYRAKEAGEQIFRQRMYRTNGNLPNAANIDALKSVSRQHKYHMLEKELKKIQEEQNTWLQELAKFFGVKEEQPPERYLGDVYPQADTSPANYG